MANSAAMSQIGAPAIQRGAWLDALRFIVACLMVLHHYQGAAPIPLSHFFPAVEHNGYLLTNFFLIDSGYVLARIYGAQVASGRIGLADFFTRRLLRLAPAHLVMSTALVGIVLAAEFAGISPRNPEWFDWSQLPAQLLLVQSYGVPGGLGWNAPTWSISALLGCYLLFPTILKTVRRMTAIEALTAGLALYALADILAWRFLGYPVYQMPLKHGFMRALPLFMMGVVLARVSETVYIAPRVAKALGLAAAILFAAVQMVGNHGLVSLALIGVIIVAAGAIPVIRGSRLVENAALASFALFITNEVVRIAWFGVMNVAADKLGWSLAVQWGVWALGFSAAIGFGFVFYQLVDRPTQALLKGVRVPSMASVGERLADRLPHPQAMDFADFAPRTGYVEVLVDKGRFRPA